MESRKVLLAAMAWLVAVPLLLAQEATAPLEEMRSAFQHLNYAAAKAAGEHALQDWQRLSPQHVIEIHQVLGIIAYSEGSFFEAKAQFEQALSLDPELRLDSLYVSPKIQQFLAEVKEHFAAGNGHAPAMPRYVLIPDPRPAAALRSLLLPGMGQFYKHQPGKARLMLVAAGTGLIATGILHLRRASARENYLTAQTITKATATYKRYNLYNRSRNGAALLTGAVWIYSFFDALLQRPQQPAVRLGGLPGSEGNTWTPLLTWEMHF